MRLDKATVCEQLARLTAATDRRRRINFAVEPQSIWLPDGSDGTYLPAEHCVIVRHAPYVSSEAYATALHELGHAHDPTIAGYGSTEGSVIRAECYAWEWAIEHALAWNRGMHETLVDCLTSYANGYRGRRFGGTAELVAGVYARSRARLMAEYNGGTND
jgi:hypothetical protein